jgi:molecular chaperone DnaJ
VRPHRLFQRNGADIYCRAPIPMTTASLGGTIEVPAIDGSRARVTLPAGTQSNRQFRLKDKGMRILRSNARGDMYIEVTVETPVNLTKRQKELLQSFEEAGKGRRTSPESESFFTRVKEFWDDLTE